MPTSSGRTCFPDRFPDSGDLIISWEHRLFGPVKFREGLASKHVRQLLFLEEYH